MQQEGSKPEKDYWVPLESNPAVLTKFAAALGVPANFAFSDCLGLDEEVFSIGSIFWHSFFLPIKTVF